MPAIKLTNDQMLEIVHTHGSYEYALDLEGTMSQLTSDIWWELHNVGLRAQGVQAVREWYSRILPMTRMVSDVVEKAVAFGPNMVILDTEMSVRYPDDTICTEPGLYIYHFRDGKICGERAFHSNRYAEVYEKSLGDIEQIPGITRI